MNDMGSGPLYLDEQGYLGLVGDIAKLERQLSEVNMGRQTAYDSDTKDNYNFALEDANREHARLYYALQHKRSQLANSIIVERHHGDTIDIGDIIEAEFEYSPGQTEIITFCLVGGMAEISSDIEQASINSPLGAAVYKKAVGEEVSYTVNGNIIKLRILAKRSLDDTPSR